MSWPNNTRRYWVDMGSKGRPVGGGLVSWDFPRSGILAAVHLIITGSVAGTLTSPNALGMASIVNLVRLTINAGIDLINMSGAGYHFLLRDMLEHYIDPVPQSNARSAVTATTFDISMYLPVAVNSRDPLGLIMLQNEQTFAQLFINFEADATVATGATVTTTAVQPFLEMFSVPLRDEDLPPQDFAQSIMEETLAVAGAGDQTFNWPRSNNYLQLVHGMGIGASGSDAFTTAKLRVGQNQFLYPNSTPQFLDKEFSRWHGRNRVAGVIPFDLLGSSGLGNYASARDAIDTGQLTDIASIVTATGAGTLRTLKRQLVPLKPNGG